MTTNQKETSIEELEDDETKSLAADLNKKEIVRLKKICSENWDTMQANITEKEYWRKRIAELEEELEFAGTIVKATKSMAETCKENREAGRDICGACSICFAEMKQRAEKTEAQLEIAIQQRSDAASQRNDLVKELDALEARSDLAEEADALKTENDKLREALEEYGQHIEQGVLSCATISSGLPNIKCNCGWTKKKAALIPRNEPVDTAEEIK